MLTQDESHDILKAKKETPMTVVDDLVKKSILTYPGL